MKLKVLGFLDSAVLYAVYGMIFFIPISISAIGIFAGIAIVSFLIRKILSPDFTGIKANKTLFLFLLLFFIFMGLSLFNSGPLLPKSLKALLIKWGRFPILLWIMIDTFRDTRRIVWGVRVFIFSAALVGLTVLTQRFFGFEFLRGRASLSYSIPSTGPFTNRNSLAAYLSCAIPIILSFSVGLWKQSRITARLCLFPVTGLLILSSFWTGCRGGWLGLITAFIFIILITNHKRMKKIFWPIFLSLYLFFMPLIGVALLFYRDNSERVLIIRGALGMIKEHPFLGMGIGTFMDRSVIYTSNSGAYYAHNCYLQIWAESGIFSLISFLLFAGYVLYRNIKTCRRAPKSIDFYILMGLSAGLLGFLVHSFFEVNFYSFQHSFLFWIVLGLTVALSSGLDRKAGLSDA